VLCAGDHECSGDAECAEGICLPSGCTIDGDCDAGYSCRASKVFPLGSERFTVEGLRGGDVIMMPDADGRYSVEVMNGRVFTTTPVSFELLSGPGDRDFPGFTVELPTPVPPVLLKAGDAENPDLAAGPSVGITHAPQGPFVVEWEAQGTEYVDFQIVPGAGSTTPYAKLRCVTHDDGCLEIPPEAIQQLALDAATSFQLKLTRYSFTIEEIREGDTLKAVVLVSLGSTLEGTVLR
jgi:hypothetical protein